MSMPIIKNYLLYQICIDEIKMNECSISHKLRYKLQNLNEPFEIDYCEVLSHAW